MKRIISNFKNPYALLFYILNKTRITRLFSDEFYIRFLYRRVMGKRINLENPLTFGDKINWLKLNYYKKEFCLMVDKYESKKYVSDLIGEEYIIPTIGVWDKFDEIDFEKLPNQFVIKCTHDSGSTILCRDKSEFNINNAKKLIESAQKRNLFYSGREYPYKNLKPRIIIEELISDNINSNTLTDYKFYCFDGYVHSVMICIDRNKDEPKFYFFNENWELLKLNKRGITEFHNFVISKPLQLQKMFQLAALLSKGIPFLRVDLYCSNNKIFFGELTLYPTNGMDPNLIEETDVLFGNMINLNLIK